MNRTQRLAGAVIGAMTVGGLVWTHSAQAAPKNFTLAQSSTCANCPCCNAELRRGTTNCDVFTPPASQVVAHRACLDKVRTTYDACRAAWCN